MVEGVSEECTPLSLSLSSEGVDEGWSMSNDEPNPVMEAERGRGEEPGCTAAEQWTPRSSYEDVRSFQ